MKTRLVKCHSEKYLIRLDSHINAYADEIFSALTQKNNCCIDIIVTETDTQ